MNTEKKIIEELIVGGVLGASLGAVISKNKDRGIAIGAIAGAALFATYKAYESAKKANQKIIFEENGVIYEDNNGELIPIKTIEKKTLEVKKSYKLK